MRLTLQPNGTVTIALVTDGQTDVVTGGRISNQAIGGLRASQQFVGDVAIGGTTVTRVGETALGNFHDEGFKAGQRIRISNAGAANGDYTIAAVALDGSSLTLTGPAAGAGVVRRARSSAACSTRACSPARSPTTRARARSPAPTARAGSTTASSRAS